MSAFVSALNRLQIPTDIAETLETRFGGDPKGFTAGLTWVARCLVWNSMPDAEVYPEPWNTYFVAISNAATIVEGIDLAGAVFAGEPEVLSAINNAIALATMQETQRPGVSRLNQGVRVQVSGALPCPDLGLQQQIMTILRGQYKDEKRQIASSILLDWLLQHGRLIQTPQGELYYLYSDDRTVFSLDSERWLAWLYSLVGVTPSGADFQTLNTHVRAAAIISSERISVVRVAYWDEQTKTLRVSRFDGTVYVLDGDGITEEANGEGPVLFDDNILWEPYAPVFKDAPEGLLTWSVELVPHFDKQKAPYAPQAFRAWLYSMFFSEICPTKPILAMLGEKGSGKSMALRVILKLIFGPWAEVSGVPDKPDGFVAAVSHQHLYVIDNLDEFTDWLRDKLARLATGSVDQYRRLYTSNEMGTVYYRCWVAVTARTPDTLRRDDLADRLLILPMSRIQDGERKRESRYLSEVNAIRNIWWGELLTALNGVVAELRAGSMPETGGWRMDDWAALGEVIARQRGELDSWRLLIDHLRGAQYSFSAEGEIVVEAIETWLLNAKNVGRQIHVRQLYQECREVLFGAGLPDSDWPKSVKSFGQRLSNSADYLRKSYGMVSTRLTTGPHYRFDIAP